MELAELLRDISAMEMTVAGGIGFAIGAFAALKYKGEIGYVPVTIGSLIIGMRIDTEGTVTSNIVEMGTNVAAACSGFIGGYLMVYNIKQRYF